MMKKITKLLLVLSTIFLINIDSVYGATLGTNFIVDDSNKDSIPTDEKTGTYSYDTEEIGETKYEYACNYSFHTNTWRWVTINAYNQENKSLIPTTTVFDKNDAILAGTAIGLSIIEGQWVYWGVDASEISLEVKESKIETTPAVYTCHYTSKDGPISVQGVNYTGNNGLSQIRIQGVCPTKEASSELGCQQQATLNCVYSHKTLKQGATKTYTDSLVEEYNFTNINSYNNNIKEKLRECAAYAINDRAITEHVNNGMLKFTANYTIRFDNSNDITEESMIMDAGESGRLDATHKKCYRENANGHKVYMDECKVDVSERSIQQYLNTLERYGVVEDEIYVDRYYNKTRTCINVKNGKVTYKSDKSECNPATEFAIENDEITLDDGTKENHWHYFLPLNAKSSDGVTIDFMGDYAGSLDSATCQRYMETKPFYYGNKETEDNYTNWIVFYDKNTNTVKDFIGDFKCDSSKTQCNKEVSKDWQSITNQEGFVCRLTTKLKIPVKQLFYNEVNTSTIGTESNSKFNGFNFYYKPIDISKSNQIDIIFPNGVKTNSSGELTTTTLWDEWYQDQKKSNSTLDLSESFNKETYRASNIKYSEVRTYNEKNPYTSWNNMNVDGTSQFVGGTITGDTENVITRVNVDTKKIYKLGCGPANQHEWLDKSETIANPLYIKGCEPKE